MDYDAKALEESKKNQGQLSIKPLIKIENKDDLSVAYTPGVAKVCKEIEQEPEKWRELTWRGNLVGVITDGSAVLGLGNIGASAGIPVMEGKSALLKTFTNVNAIPIGLATQDAKEIIQTVKNIKHSFGAINLEDISAPRCFEIEEALQNIGIPVFHDDQHGTAIVVLAALQNAIKRVGKDKQVKVVISGAGAAGIAIANLLLDYGITNMSVIDSKGIINKEREDLNKYKQKIAERTNAKKGTLKTALEKADVFVGVSKGNLLTAQDIKTMNEKAIVLAMSNPTPEIPIQEAKKAENLAIFGTGRSDQPNQVNNALAFPGLFKGMLNAKATKVKREVFLEVAKTLAENADPNGDILPKIINEEIHQKVIKTVEEFYEKNIEK